MFWHDFWRPSWGFSTFFFFLPFHLPRFSQGLAPHAADLAVSTPKPYKTDQNKGPGAFPSSRLDSHRNFEPFWLGYVDFRAFPTRFVPLLSFASANALSARAKFALDDKQPPSWGSFNRFYRREQNLLSEIIVPPSWRSFDRFYR